MVTRQDGQIRCFVLPVSASCQLAVAGPPTAVLSLCTLLPCPAQDAHNADSSRELPADKHQLQIYKDKDGTVW